MCLLVYKNVKMIRDGVQVEDNFLLNQVPFGVGRHYPLNMYILGLLCCEFLFPLVF